MKVIGLAFLLLVAGRGFSQEQNSEAIEKQECPVGASVAASQCRIRLATKQLDQGICVVKKPSHPDVPKAELEQKIGSVVAWLNKSFPVLRVGTDTTGGYGHQSASFEVIRSLLRLGYKGKIQVVPSEGPDTERIKNLFAEFATEPQVTIVSVEEASKHRESLSFMGGNDNNGVVDGMNAKMHFSFQPLQWEHNPRMICIDTPCGSNFKNHDTDRGRVWCESANHPCFAPRTLQSEEQSFHYDIETRADFAQLSSRFLKEESTRKNANLVVRAIEQKKVNLMVAYFGNAERYNLCEITAGLRFFQNHYENKGIIILSFVADDILCKVSENDKITLSQLSSDRPITLPGENEILVLRAPRLPDILFRELIRKSNLPTVLEGANTTNFLRILQRPYISTWFGRTRLPPIDCDQVKSAIEGVTHSLNIPLLDLYNFQDLSQPIEITHPAIRMVGDLVGKFIVASKTPHSAVAQYFQELGRINSLPENDMVATGLIELANFLDNAPKGFHF